MGTYSYVLNPDDLALFQAHGWFLMEGTQYDVLVPPLTADPFEPIALYIDSSDLPQLERVLKELHEQKL